MLLKKVSGSSLLNFSRTCDLQKRNYIGFTEIYQYIIKYKNRYRPTYVNKLGAERACAEWLIRCAADVRLKGKTEFLTSLRQCREVKDEDFFIEEINASDSCLTGIGFKYFEGVRGLKSFKMHYCNWLDDDCLARLTVYCSDSLEHLEIVACGGISFDGLLRLPTCKKLKYLYVENLPFLYDMRFAPNMEALKLVMNKRCLIVVKGNPLNIGDKTV